MKALFVKRVPQASIPSNKKELICIFQAVPDNEKFPFIHFQDEFIHLMAEEIFAQQSTKEFTGKVGDAVDLCMAGIALPFKEGDKYKSLKTVKNKVCDALAALHAKNDQKEH